jgi:hypothetical protein
VTSADDAIPRKFIAFFRLIDACAAPGCPVCRCLTADSRHYLESLLHEHVNDPAARGRLHASWGFCNWHAWMLPEAPAPGLGSAILCEDLLRVLVRRFEGRASRLVRSGLGGLGWPRWLGGRPRRSLLAALHRRRAICSACGHMARAEQRYVGMTLQYVDDPQFDRAYRRSHGLCVPHTLQALEIGAGSAGAEQLVARTLPRWAELRRDLEQLVSKHDCRNTVPFTEAEGAACVRALEVLTGAPGVFGNDVRAGDRPVRARQTVDARLGGPAEGVESDPGFERARLELRVKELTEQLNEASSRAAALHYRLAQVAEDRNVLELNVSGERAANELSRRLIAQLREEIARLRAELSELRSAGT